MMLDMREEVESEFDPALIHRILTEVLGEDYLNDSKDELFSVADEMSRRSSISIQADNLSVSSGGKTSRSQNPPNNKEKETRYDEENNEDESNALNLDTILRMIDRNEVQKQQQNFNGDVNSECDSDVSSQQGMSQSSQQNTAENKQQPNDVLDVVEMEEMQDLESLPADLAAANKQYPLIFESIQEQNFIHGDNMNFYLHSLVSKFMAKHPAFVFTCIKVHFESNFIERVCLGGEDGSIAVLDGNYQQQQKESYSIFKLTQQASRSVICLDISYNGNFMVSGFSDGALGFWDISKKQCVKLTTNLFESAVLQAKFINSDTVLLSDNKGNVSVSKIKKNLLAYNVENKIIISSAPFAFYQIKLRRTQYLLHGHSAPTPCLLAALVAMDFIIIIMLEPTVTHVARIENESNQKIPYFAWSPSSSSPNNLQFAIGTGSLMKIYGLVNLYEDTPGHISHENPTFISFYQSSKEMLYTEYLNENLLFYIDANNILTIIALHRFKPASSYQALPLNLLDTRFVLKPEESADCVVFREMIKADINFHILIRTENDLIKSCHANSIIVHENTIYLLGTKQLVNGKLEQWHSYISKLIEKSDWIQALYKLIRIYRGDDLLYADISSIKESRKVQMESFIQSTSRRYLEEVSSILKEQNSEELWVMRIWTLTEFLVALDHFDFIFTELMQMITSLGALTYFMRVLEPFILRKSIKYIPPSSLRAVLDYLLVKSAADSKHHLAKKLIVQLDYSAMDVDSTIRVCCEFKLFAALAYLYPRNNADFKTLAFQMYAQFVQTSSIDSKTAHLCMWFIRHSLRGYQYPKESMDRSLHAQAVIQLASWLFVQETLSALLHVNCWLLFEILILFFKQPSGVFIQSTNDSLYSSISIDNKLCTVKEAAAMQANLLEVVPSVHSLMISLIERSINQQDVDETTCFQLFILEAVFLGYEISLQHVYNCTEFFFANPNFGSDKNSSLRLSLESKSERLIKMISIYSEELQQSTEMLNQLILKASYSPFIEVTAFLHYSIRDYKKCIDLYVSAPQRHVNQKIFGFLEQIFTDMAVQAGLSSQPSQQTELMQYIFATKLKDLVRFDSEKTRVFIETYSRAGDEANQAIEKLSAFPDLQYKLLDKIIKNKRAKGAETNIPHNLLVLHIELIATFHPQNLLSELKAYDYPLDESLQITIKKGILDATAYLYERTGDIVQAITLYIEVFKAKLIQMTTNNSNVSETKLQMGLVGYLKPCIEICISHNKKGDKDSEDNWFLVIDKIMEIQRKCQREGTLEKRVMANFFSAVVNEIVETMLHHVRFDCFIESLLDILSVYTLKDMKATFQRLLHELCFEQQVLTNSIHILKQNCHAQHLKIMSFYSKGHKIQNKCCACQQKIESTAAAVPVEDVSDAGDSELVIFNCKHTSHRRCVVGQMYCPVCVDDPSFLWIQTIYKLKTYKGLHDSSHNLDESGRNKESKTNVDNEIDKKNAQKRAMFAKLKQFEESKQEAKITVKF